MTWIERAQALLNTETGEGCHKGHDNHDRIVWPVHAPGFEGPMTIFDAEKYRNTEGYCMGDDDVSRTLSLYGIWEPIETGFVMDALTSTEGLVIDFGTQIGWYSMLATETGHDVLGIEAIAEHEEMTRINTAGRSGNLWQAQRWICDDTPILDADDCPPICLVKIDIEGAERFALRCVKNLLDADLVSHILLEVSPVFNNSYQLLLTDLLSRGFTATALNPVQPLTVDNYLTLLDEIPQFDVMFSK